MITWNKYHNWRQTSPLWRMMDELPDEKAYRDMTYVFRLEDGTRRTRRGPWRNILWYEISKEFDAMFGGEFALRETRTMGEWEIYVTTCVCSCLRYDIQFRVNGTHYAIRPPGNMEYTPENIWRVVMEYVEKNLLFGAGWFRAIQLHTRWSKEQVREWYKRNKAFPSDGERYDVPATEKAIRRHLNIDVREVGIDAAGAWINAHGRQQSMTVLNYWDDAWMNGLDGDIDELEREFWRVADEYPKNTAFINVK